ncbi:GGDEF domain-containing protein [Sphingomonadaceae bacterium LXI357]|uniref:diguanylate cyclase n=1 Tax=Stakelama marina TaxID=2826939 RepID=A0A8T4ID28_9SPHN|nr:GGDEF domain-containing protein [Stakelama marina]
MAATMVCVSTETLVLRYASHSTLGVAAISLLVPAAYLCASQAIRLSMGAGVTSRRLVAIAAVLTGLSLVLLAVDAVPFVQCLPFQLAGVVMFLDAVLALARQKRRGVLGNGLLVLCCCSMTGIAIRIPMFPLLLGQPTPFPIMSAETFERVFVNSLGVLTTGLALFIIARIVANEMASYRYRSERDDLTGLLNRRMLGGMLDRPAATAGAVVMCDIDRFKTINDRFGHHVGDEVIQSFAAILKGHAGHVGRVGGEEFALLLFGASSQEAGETADAIRCRFQQFQHPAVGEAGTLSASFGVAAFDTGASVRSAMRQADKALYAAKRTGRNRVCIAPDEATVRRGMQHAA